MRKFFSFVFILVPIFVGNSYAEQSKGQIAFYSTRDGHDEIYVMDADGSNERRTTRQEGIDENGYWSPDGEQIVFQTDRDGNYEIYIMDRDGSNQRRLTIHPAGDYWPSWSKDPGEKIKQE